MCILLVHLSLISGHLSSQKIETIVKEKADSTYHPPDSLHAVPIDQLVDSLEQSVQTRACVNSITNQTVSTFEVVEGCTTLDVQYVTVTNSGDLHLLAPGDITINGDFDVYLGGQLNMNGTPPPPPGNTIQTAINIGTFGSSFQYTDSRNTMDYTNNYVGQSTNDVFYIFTITVPMEVTIKHCNSSIDTYMHLLDASGNVIAYNNDYYGTGACSNPLHAYIKQTLQPGTYYILSEGYNTNGVIQTEVKGNTPQYDFNYIYDASGNRISRTN